MNKAQQAYLDGASMAYKDCADFIDRLVSEAPSEIQPLMQVLSPISIGMRLKAKGVYEEAARMEGVKQ